VWNALNQFTQVCSAAVVANPPGDADVQPHFEIGIQLFARARETVKHSRNALPGPREDLAESLPRIALMQEQRQL